MLRNIMLVAGFTVATTAPGFAAEWFVIRGADGCFVTDQKSAGEDAVSKGYASEAEATEEMKAIAACDEANTNLDPDEDRDTGQ